jgi:hypothetical protein
MPSSAAYKMRLSLNVLEHLGLNLYSNVPAVLSEAVANAWDADAERVDITLDLPQKQIIIQDDGTGMTKDDINDRFLFVGYQRRTGQPGPTLKNRMPMGRKGIGKLSLFSIADEILVETARDREQNALRMSLDAIKTAIGKQSPSQSGEYYPDECDTQEIEFQRGTRITLTGLRKRQAISTAVALRMRLARRFSIIGNTHGFDVAVNGEVITSADRGYSSQMQYAWEFNGESLVSIFPNLEHQEQRLGRISLPEDDELVVSGWVGTVRETKQLRDDSGDNLNRIAIFVRGKMAQEDMLGDFGETGVYAGYVIGELRVNGLDTDDQEDSATSGRQRILEDDRRYMALKGFMKKELSHIEIRWQALRKSRGVQIAEKIPEIKKWLDQLPPSDAREARRWLGRIYRVRVNAEDERRQLLKQAVFAFEFHRWNQKVDHLQLIEDNNLEAAIAMFRELDVLEANLYGQIVRNRIEVIKTLQEKVDKNQKERAIQEYIFDHLWLLDPNWERVEGSQRMEKQVGTLFENLDAGLSKEERLARLDIKYRQVAGKHVIVELKRPERLVSVHDLSKQIGKYRSGMVKLLQNIKRSNEPVEFICILGRPPQEWDDPGGQQVVENTLQAQNARHVTYDLLLDRSFRAYKDYLNSAKEISRLSEIMSALDRDETDASAK